MAHTGDEVVTTLDAADQLGLDVIDVYKLIDAGRLPAQWDGKRLVVRVADLGAVSAAGA